MPLLEDYNGTVLDGEVTWLPTLGGAGASTGLSGGAQKPATNPMFGVETFLRVEGTYTYRYAELNLSGVQNGVGRILRGGLPGEAPVYSDRDWLKAPTLWVRRGVIYDITEIYLLSGVGGWPKPVYGGGVTEGGSNGRYLQGAGRA